MLFAKYRSESLGGRRHRPTSSESSGLPHAPSTSQPGSSAPGPFPNSPPYAQPHAQAAAPAQRYPGSVPRHPLSVSPTQSRAVPVGGGPPPPMSYHPDASGPPGSMVLTFEQGEFGSCDFFFPLLSPRYLPTIPRLLRRPELNSRDRFRRFRKELRMHSLYSMGPSHHVTISPTPSWLFTPMAFALLDRT